jgi:hypothetical protein
MDLATAPAIDRTIVGKPLVGRNSVTIIGVLPPTFL